MKKLYLALLPLSLIAHPHVEFQADFGEGGPGYYEGFAYGPSYPPMVEVQPVWYGPGWYNGMWFGTDVEFDTWHHHHDHRYPHHHRH